MPRKASRTPRRASNARDSARTPAPPVSTSVPSMSKRISETRGASIDRLAFAANVAGARPFRRGLFFEVDALAFIQLVEASLHRATVEEPLLPAIVANEPEPTITHESLDSAARHPSLLGHARVPRPGLSISVPSHIRQKSWFHGRARPAGSRDRRKRIRLCTNPTRVRLGPRALG